MLNIEEIKKNSPVYVAKNSRGRVIKYYDVPLEYIKKQLGFSGSLVLLANSYYKADSVALYRFYYKDFKESALLRALLYGRDNSIGTLALTETGFNALCAFFESYEFWNCTIKVFTYGINKGIAAEDMLCNIFHYKKASERQDKNQAIDCIDENGKRIQVKASICTLSSRGKGGTTNTRTGGATNVSKK